MPVLLDDMARVMELLTAPMGAYAPRLRRLVVDYKDGSGADYNHDLLLLCPPEGTDKKLVEDIRDSLSGQGFTLTSLAEMAGDGVKVLYLHPQYLRESIEEQGMPVPEDMAANMASAGIHPVNWEEFVHGR